MKDLTNMEKKKIEVSELYALCNKEQFFTCGSVSQYDKMFKFARNGITRDELAAILYVCSSYEWDAIYNSIAFLFN